MQVFYPEETAKLSVKALDDKRLGKQRLECIQILLSLHQIEDVWKIPKSVHNHPTTLLWANNKEYLLYYTACCLWEWDKRRFKNEKCLIAFDKLYYQPSVRPWSTDLPRFITPDFIKDHKIKLYNKNPVFYAKYKDVV